MAKIVDRNKDDRMREQNFDITGQSIITNCLRNKNNLNEIYLPILPRFYQIPNLSRKRKL